MRAGRRAGSPPPSRRLHGPGLAMAEAFVGTWKLMSSCHFDDYMKAIGERVEGGWELGGAGTSLCSQGAVMAGGLETQGERQAGQEKRQRTESEIPGLAHSRGGAKFRARCAGRCPRASWAGRGLARRVTF